jgi:hypothetical protein
VDAEARQRARTLFEQGAPTEEVVKTLRAEGVDIIASIRAVAHGGDLSHPEARAAVLESATWADQRHLVSTNQWIDPPDLPDAATLERVRAICRDEPRISGAWLTGSRFTGPDGPPRDSTAIAFVFDPPLGEGETTPEAPWDILSEVRAALPDPCRAPTSLLYVSDEIIAAKAEYCRLIYSRGPSARPAAEGGPAVAD